MVSGYSQIYTWLTLYCVCLKYDRAMKILANDYPSNIPGGHSISTGGPMQFTKNFSADMRRKGHVWVSVVQNYVPHGSPRAQMIRTSRQHRWWSVECSRTYIKRAFTNRTTYADPERSGSALIRAYGTVLDAERPDLVFINGIAATVWALLIAAHRRAIPVVVQHAGIWSFEAKLYKSYFTPAGLRTIKKMEKDFVCISARNVFLNEFSRNTLAKIVRPLRIRSSTVIPLPYSHSRSTKHPVRRKRKGSKKITIGIVARWDHIKNHKAVLALAEYAHRHALPWEFHAVTKIPETAKNANFKTAYRTHIKVLKPRSQRSLLSFYQSMDIMLLPSLLDVSPHVVLEAAFQGVPTAISPSVGYAPVFKKHGAARFVVDFSRTPKSVAQQVQSLIGKPYPSALMRTLARDHDPTRIARHYERIFTDLITSTNS